MRQLTCEMCGSTDMLKQDGVFVCQCCGCKYSVEEAKKMMVEGTVQVEGTVKVDNKDKIENYLKMAESAYESENLKEAEDYANKIIEIWSQEAWDEIEIQRDENFEEISEKIKKLKIMLAFCGCMCYDIRAIEKLWALYALYLIRKR